MAKRKTNSTNSDSDRFKRVADQVQQTRRNSRLSVRKVSLMSNLPESTIRALENPTRSNLPSANVIGLYKVYASSLRIPASKVTALIGRGPEVRPEFSLRRLPKLKSLVVFSNIGSAVAVVVVLSVVMGYAAWQSFGLVSAPNLEVSFPSESYMVIDESSIDVAGTAERESTVLINGQPTTVNSESGSFKQTIYLQEGYNYITVEVVNSFATKTTKSFVVVYDVPTRAAKLILESS